MNSTEVKQNIDDLSNLQDNWDGYSAIKPIDLIIEKTKQFLNRLNIFQLTKLTDIYPNPHGTISIEFINKEQKICIEIGQTNATYFYRINKIDTIFCDEFDIEFDYQIIKYINELSNVFTY